MMFHFKTILLYQNSNALYNFLVFRSQVFLFLCYYAILSRPYGVATLSHLAQLVKNVSHCLFYLGLFIDITINFLILGTIQQRTTSAVS